MSSSTNTLVAVLLIAVAMAAFGWQPLDPEQVLFGFSRCGEDFTPNDLNRETRIRNWAVWKLEPRDNWTMCYVRCCLERLGLFDRKTNMFMPERVTVQHKAYKNYNGLNGATVKEFKKALQVLPKLDNCTAVFNALFGKLGKHLPTIMKLYHGSPNITKLIYQDKGRQIRQKHQSYSEFCEDKYFPKGSKVLCAFRKTGSAKHPDFKKVINCIFKGFRYLDENGTVNPEEIIRDFRAVKQINMDSSVRCVISKCRVQEESKAFDYYECLRLNKRLLGKFEPAFRYREMRSSDYDYAFKIPGPPVFDPTAVRKNHNRMTKRQCLGTQ